MDQKVNVDANDVIAAYRKRVDELEFENTVLRLQLQSDKADSEKDSQSAGTAAENQESQNQ